MKRNTSKIWIKNGKIEITIEGPPDFVSKQYQEIINGIKPKKNETIHSTSKQKTITSPKKSLNTGGTIKKAATSNQQDYSSLLSTLSNTDKVLLTAYYVTFTKKDNVFSIREVIHTLSKRGIEIMNAAQIIKDTAFEEKIIKPILDNGKKYYYFTGEGKEYMKELLSVSEQ